MGFPGGSNGKEFACIVGDLHLIRGSERAPGEGNDCPLQYSCLKNPMNRRAWWATVCRVTKSQIWLKLLSSKMYKYQIFLNLNKPQEE